MVSLASAKLAGQSVSTQDSDSRHTSYSPEGSPWSLLGRGDPVGFVVTGIWELNTDQAPQLACPALPALVLGCCRPSTHNFSAHRPLSCI